MKERRCKRRPKLKRYVLNVNSCARRFVATVPILAVLRQLVPPPLMHLALELDGVAIGIPH